jgi:hypothetical protein
MCAITYGTAQSKVMGMHGGVCDLCGNDGALSNAWHDWDIDDDHALRIKHIIDAKKAEDAEQ